MSLVNLHILPLIPQTNVALAPLNVPNSNAPFIVPIALVPPNVVLQHMILPNQGVGLAVSVYTNSGLGNLVGVMVNY